jgi:hypothetical protein
MVVEYRVKRVERYIVTRSEQSESGRSVVQRGFYEGPQIAYEVAYALCKAEHEKSGEDPGSMNFIYPAREDWMRLDPPATA